MSSPTSRTINDTSFHVGLLPVTAVSIVVAAALSPLAYYQYGWIGVGVVGAAGIVVIASVWTAAWCAKVLLERGQSVGAFLVGSAIRMVLPLTLALGLVFGGAPLIRPSVVIYLVPLYLAMLFTDTLCLMRSGALREQPHDSLGTPAESVGGNIG